MNLIYLITGGAGFLGGNIVSQLTQRGDQVRVMALPGDKNRIVSMGGKFTLDHTAEAVAQNLLELCRVKLQVVIHIHLAPQKRGEVSSPHIYIYCKLGFLYDVPFTNAANFAAQAFVFIDFGVIQEV